MLNRIIKKEVLFKFIEEGKVKTATILAVPTKELQEAYFNMSKNSYSLINLLKKYNIESKLHKYDDTAIAFYFPKRFVNGRMHQATEIVAIHVQVEGFFIQEEDGEIIETPNLQNRVEKEIEKILNNLVTEVIDYYQASIHPMMLDKMIESKMYGEGITFSDMLLLIPEKNQAKLAELVGVNRGTISDYKADRGIPSLKVLAKLMNLYPLLPWDHYIGDIK